tara:strand:- start:402 stop:1124 length:723 start_codon:yes stop_codon:yes gene_type:complete
MKAVILAAGMGKRISNLTNGLPKSLLPLNDSSIIGYTLDILFKNDIKDLHVVTGYKSDLIKDYVLNNWKGDVAFTNNPIYEKSNVLYSLYLSMPSIIDDDIIFIHADTIFSAKILRNLINKKNNTNILLPVEFKKCGEEEMKVITKDGKITDISKNIPLDVSEGEFLGLASIKSPILKMIKEKSEEMFAENNLSFFIEAAIQKLITDKDLIVNYYDIKNEPWIEIDTENDYKKACEIFRK